MEKITAWVEDALLNGGFTDSREKFTVSICEVSCSDPGCTPVETVISLLGSEAQTDQTKSIKNLKGKIFKPIFKVSREDVIEALPRILKALDTEKQAAQIGAGNVSILESEGGNTKKKSLIDLWAEEEAKNAGHPEFCVCCAPIQ